ncbi:recombinase-like helix-turn-helix domain-containing protein [Shimwellia blattae]|uniref:Recombinase-like domain-containing protein n=1 Tax=Shimwellia blattae (strain ATCC 29907 / DSM 4481 / JCM 1650 / NBRC 105725 / CDC 9005-74) TaxID=630626 RepID=I2B5A4_SHIBC|nr:recombinase-like helix-turn-helix domain-containing protein [Shimwellia blattae]AFJ45708.1 hypothetical protein EBL_c05830 [Shimwellia blattae DSM 4481 = NBRC 105725]GAB82156.1 hypothetical protein EB105725_20_00510 [Shimwellia blattae DSM 4481 = NBRC 105725]VDY63190.1 Uncharacterised protein [Shimwellia blattae]VEC20846.1 Uncharacterised protein [Shimwellia blattae]
MSHRIDTNPHLPQSHPFQPPKEGGNGSIHKPGQFQNIIWQTRSRVPDAFELGLIDALEQLFEQGISALPELIQALNGQKQWDPQGQPWSEQSFRAFLQVNGY